ncbi:hypothetical protein BDV95DRAFT_596899 [Massariosphaeria phaeospora]|uniref:Uncharacterized protein n=1 Tax=Massariosphaeria phaeospora TaxID=100035 RepID=A0A7C8I5D3_9PLEO|nr:hypothetical protein BDV95DRAFT_596899 [Massariosphaeria phaeospora]
MRAVILFFVLLGLASAFALERHEDPAPPDYDDDSHEGDDEAKHFRPKTRNPQFFNLRVDDRCDPNGQYGPEEPPTACPFANFAIRLENKIVIATPYNRWYDPPLPTFFVDDDTQIYTVSKDPLQLYVDTMSGALKYTRVGWLPPNAVSTSFYHSGSNPLGMVDPSPSYLSWPSTYGITNYGKWWLCDYYATGQYQVFVDLEELNIQGVNRDDNDCKPYPLAAINANPWKKQKSWHHHGGHGDSEPT